MSPLVKLGLGLFGISLVSGPGIWMLISAEPACKTVSEDNNNTEYNGKFGEDFKHHMVSIKEESNSEWWNWSFKYRWTTDNNSEQDSEFKDITDGEALKKKCEAAYKKETKDNISNKETYEKSVWRYCSLEGQKPLTVKEAGNKSEEGASDTDTGKIGKANETKLISVLEPRNKKFWLIQQKAFFKVGDIDGLGKKSQEQDSEFKKLYEKNPRGLDDTLINTCKTIYKKTSSDKDKKDALAYCSLQPKE